MALENTDVGSKTCFIFCASAFAMFININNNTETPFLHSRTEQLDQMTNHID